MNWFKKMWNRLHQESVEEISETSRQALMTGTLVRGDNFVMIVTMLPEKIGVLTDTEENELLDLIEGYFERLAIR